VWVGLEVDGVRYSTDGGDTWARVNGQIPNQDVHNVLVVEGPPKTVFTVVNDDEHLAQHRRRQDVARGARPRGLSVALSPRHRGSSRTIRAGVPDPGRLHAGRIGTMMRSRDAGATWRA